MKLLLRIKKYDVTSKALSIEFRQFYILIIIAYIETSSNCVFLQFFFHKIPVTKSIAIPLFVFIYSLFAESGRHILSNIITLVYFNLSIRISAMIWLTERQQII